MKKLWLIATVISVVVSGLFYFSLIPRLIPFILGVCYALVYMHKKGGEKTTETESAFSSSIAGAAGLLVVLKYRGIIEPHIYETIIAGLCPFLGIVVGIMFNSLFSKKH